MIDDDKIKLFTFNDKSLKILGELLSNETSRRIINALIEKEMYTNELSIKLNISISLVAHHLKKLEQLNLVEIKEKPIVKKGNNHKHFRMIPNLFVGPNHIENMEKSGSLKKIFKEGIKFASVGITSLLLWGYRNSLKNISDDSTIGDAIGSVDETPFYEETTFLPLMLIIAFLIIEKIYQKRKKG